MNDSEKEKRIQELIESYEEGVSALQIMNANPDLAKELLGIFDILKRMDREKKSITPTHEALSKILDVIPYQPIRAVQSTPDVTEVKTPQTRLVAYLPRKFLAQSFYFYPLGAIALIVIVVVGFYGTPESSDVAFNTLSSSEPSADVSGEPIAMEHSKMLSLETGVSDSVANSLESPLQSVVSALVNLGIEEAQAFEAEIAESSAFGEDVSIVEVIGTTNDYE